MPIVDGEGRYLGMIDRRDFLFILKYQMFDIVRAAINLALVDCGVLPASADAGEAEILRLCPVHSGVL